MIHTEIVLVIDALSSGGDGIGRTVAIADPRAGRRTGGRPGSPWNRHPTKKTVGKGSPGGAGGRRPNEGGQVVFVAGTVPGDTVRVRVIGERKRFLVARLLEVLTPGPDRVAPRCAHFGRCGGCDWQQLAYPAQLAAKTRQLAETLARIGARDTVDVLPVEPCDPPWNYRNRIQGEIRDGRYHQRERGTGELVAIARCEIADEAINARLLAGFDGVDPGRVELATGGVAHGDADAPATEPVRILRLNDERTTALGFRQVNAAIEARLIARLADEVAGTSSGHVLDLYCGRGTLTCRIAERCPERRLIGIDAGPDNIRAARTTQRALGLDNVEFRQGRVERQLGQLPLANAACIVDPPRAGLERALIDALNANPVRRLWYVSCHPATLARDLALLCEGPYRVDTVQPFDMFPQTAHLESLTTLSVTA